MYSTLCSCAASVAAVQEVGGPLSRQRAVSVAASKTRTAVTTQLGDVYFWDAKPQAARHSQRAAQQQQQQKGAAQEAGSLPSSLPKGEGPGSWGNVVLGSSPERGGRLCFWYAGEKRVKGADTSPSAPKKKHSRLGQRRAGEQP
eukprot:scaffold69271_cov18-Tisochrysis_lutea.AAC.1